MRSLTDRVPQFLQRFKATYVILSPFRDCCFLAQMVFYEKFCLCLIALACLLTAV